MFYIDLLYHQYELDDILILFLSEEYLV